VGSAKPGVCCSANDFQREQPRSLNGPRKKNGRSSFGAALDPKVNALVAAKSRDRSPIERFRFVRFSTVKTCLCQSFRHPDQLISPLLPHPTSLATLAVEISIRPSLFSVVHRTDLCAGSDCFASLQVLTYHWIQPIGELNQSTKFPSFKPFLSQQDAFES